ncbi:hypothetical protein EYF80_035236 [Liparis tanakae]|uniref:Uncharacterized protein n=1 Tax=Liparis tanakae TaxID=230148 RepID=A0A4Z2GNZ3_9TELE|nr:hypothetical protein EYF80_035236 [Liparis tanakae]
MIPGAEAESGPERNSAVQSPERANAATSGAVTWKYVLLKMLGGSLALHIDRLHRQTARDTEESEGEVSEKDREAEGERRALPSRPSFFMMIRWSSLASSGDSATSSSSSPSPSVSAEMPIRVSKDCRRERVEVCKERPEGWNDNSGLLSVIKRRTLQTPTMRLPGLLLPVLCSDGIL